ncbi:MAG TPA: DUF86 domain-containing protein [Smithellaceae bacterium]|nr:DUF86 domain-containing protein [Smithellaceae bacterium]
MPRNESRDPAYLWDMLDAASAISTFVAGRTFHDFQTDRMLRNAIERNMEIIGEAANRVSENFQKAHPKILWRNIVGQRNILIHEYGEVKNERIWGFASVIARLDWAIQLLLYSNQTAK